MSDDPYCYPGTNILRNVLGFLNQSQLDRAERRKGNGELRREVGGDRKGQVTRYNLAYINVNGRVIGYDNAHGYHHRHYFGVTDPVGFVSFEDIED